MSQLKAADSTRTEKMRPGGRSTVADVHELISKLMEYEDMARRRCPDQYRGRLKMLTRSERRFYRAELVGDYIRLAVADLGGTPGYFASALAAFSQKICEMETPSLELMGTYLAAADVVSNEERLKRITHLDAAIRRTIVQVLRSCVAIMRERASADSTGCRDKRTFGDSPA
ncbi:MAG: hypothetical protein ACPL7K_04355 [Armatimonadota bacterium]